MSRALIRREMVAQARVRNATSGAASRVEIRHGSVERLSFEDDTFDKVLAISTMQVCPDAMAG